MINNKLKIVQFKLCQSNPPTTNRNNNERRKLIMLTVIQKEKEILYFVKNKVKELRNLLESKEVQKKYKINADCLEWNKYTVNIDNFTMRYRETGADLITISIKDSVKDLYKFKMAIEEISKEHKLALYVNDAYMDEEEADEYDDWFLRLSSPSMNRNIQTMRLMTYQESEKINSLFSGINRAKNKSLSANIRSIRNLLNLGVDVMLNLSYKSEEVTGRIKRMDDDDIELLVQCQPELVTISTLQMKDPWVINKIEGETPINWMWSNRRRSERSTNILHEQQQKQQFDEFLSSMPWEKA